MINTPQQLLKQHLKGITAVKKTESGDDLKEIERIETTFKAAINWIEFMLGFANHRKGLNLTKKEIDRKAYHHTYYRKHKLKLENN